MRGSSPRRDPDDRTPAAVGRRRVSRRERRIVENDGGLVYVAQPGGGLPTEFALTELSATRAVFDNDPRHDYPKRIAYELTPEGGMTATIDYLKGDAPRRFDFEREGK